MSKTKLLQGFLGITISLTIVVWLLRYCDLETLLVLLNKVDMKYVFAASAIYLLTYYLRAYRFKLTLEKYNISMANHLSIVAIHTLFNHLLPFRTGELSYIYLRGKINKLSLAVSSYSLLIVRFFDVCSLFFMVITFYLLLLFVRTNELQYLFIFIFLCLILFFFLEKIIFAFLAWLSSKTKDLNYSCEKGFLFRIYGFFLEINKILPVKARDGNMIKIFLISCANWVVTSIYFFLLFVSYDKNISYSESVLPSIGAILGNLLPVNGFGSIGTFEAGLTLGQIYSGSDASVAVAVAFLVHFHAILTGTVVAVLIGGIMYYKYNHRISRELL
ncbi:lysylphosphatidylglycerol synthase transmembrane domain-containing protein [Candidatus Electrothrix sp.]|uniref:lysylphosphatidylglycerol synthase transmembrane domain-containing protein n=1 Tax=Candidatus Electrothrix sp. TaxID=2170559 RepID=UPI0040576ECE